MTLRKMVTDAVIEALIFLEVPQHRIIELMHVGPERVVRVRKSSGLYRPKGQKPTGVRERIRELRKSDHTWAEILDICQCSRATVSLALKETVPDAVMPDAGWDEYLEALDNSEWTRQIGEWPEDVRF